VSARLYIASKIAGAALRVANAARRAGGMPVATDFSKSETAIWHEATNPLRGLTVDRAIALYDNARRGCYADLTWLYQEIEAADPTLMVCTERRAAGVEEIDWLCRPKSAKRLGKTFDQVLADEQAAFLEAAYGACPDLLDGIEHLATAFFRGFAHCVPRYAAGGRALASLETLDAWNFCRNRATGEWLWNPDARGWATVDNFRPIPPTELASLVRTRHIDYPALTIYIRAALGERLWGKFIERYGVPPVMIVMPEFAEKSDEATYMAAAQRVASGGSGALPNGATVTYATEARGTNPFTEYLKHQQELVVLLATGGLATSLSMPAGLGEGASGQHGSTWRTIVRRDSRFIAAALNARVSADLLAAQYPGRPVLAEFAFQVDPPATAAEVFDAGTKAVGAGYRIAQADLESKSGYKLETFSGPAPATAVAANKELLRASAPPREIPSAEELSLAAMDALAEARRRQLAPVIDRLLSALEEPDEQALRTRLATLLQDLPGLVAQLKIPEADIALVERILSDAVGAGFADGGRVTARNAFDPSQPRDEQGQWTETGGGGMSWRTAKGSSFELRGQTLTFPFKSGGDTVTQQIPYDGYEDLSPALRAKFAAAKMNPDDYRQLKGHAAVVSMSEKPQLDEALRRVRKLRASQTSPALSEADKHLARVGDIQRRAEAALLSGSDNNVIEHGRLMGEHARELAAWERAYPAEAARRAAERKRQSDFAQSERERRVADSPVRRGTD
jgi:phage gp29-like protein